MLLRTGSLGVIEDFFGEEFSERGKLTPRIIISCNDETLKRLHRKLEGAGYWGAMAFGDSWLASIRSEISGRPLIPVSLRSDFEPTFLLYADSIVVPDPFSAEVLERFSVAAQLRQGLEPYLTHLARIAPLVRGGQIVLIPPSIGMLFAGSTVNNRDALGDILYTDYFRAAHDVLESASNNMEETGQSMGSADATAVAAATHRLTMYGVSVAIDGDIIDLIPSSPRRVETRRNNYAVVRTDQLARLFLPSYSGLSVADIISLRKNSEASAQVRVLLSRILDAPPADLSTEEAAKWVQDMVRTELQPQLANLANEARSLPTGDVMTTAFISLSAAIAELQIVGDVGLGTALVGAGAWLPMAVQWISRSREARAGRIIRRVMLNALADSRQPPRWMLEVRAT